MMTVAISTPIRIGRIAFFQSISRIVAIREPVQAPVPGSGMPTKSSRPRNSTFRIFSALPCSHRSPEWGMRMSAPSARTT